MALIVEDGTGKPDANSYVSEAECTAYLAARGKAIAGSKEVAIIKAMDFMRQNYRGRWQGIKKTDAQALDWPRYDVVVDGYSVLSTIVPIEVKNACCELAFRADTEDLMPDLTQGVKREKIDVIEVEYDTSSSQQKRFNAVTSMLGPYLTGSTTMVRLQRV
jgi:hypothetical protein